MHIGASHFLHFVRSAWWVLWPLSWEGQRADGWWGPCNNTLLRNVSPKQELQEHYSKSCITQIIVKFIQCIPPWHELHFFMSSPTPTSHLPKLQLVCSSCQCPWRLSSPHRSFPLWQVYHLARKICSVFPLGQVCVRNLHLKQLLKKSCHRAH